MAGELKVGQRAVVLPLKSKGHGEVVSFEETAFGRKVHVKLDSGETVSMYYSLVNHEKAGYRARA